MNAISFLINEHNRFRKTFNDISETSHRDETKRKMLSDLCKDLVRHETMEQNLWYPHFKDKDEFKDIVKHLVSEEKTAAGVIKDLEKAKSQKEWQEKFLKLKHDVEHHANEEETKLFPRVKNFLSEKKLEEIGKEMSELKGHFRKAA